MTTYSISRHELARLLHRHRIDRDESLAHIEARSRTHLRRIRRTTPTPLMTTIANGIDLLETSSHDTIELHATDIEFISEAYSISRLLLYSLASEAVADCLVQSHDDFTCVTSMSGTDDYEKSGTEYLVPNKRLAGTEDVAVVQLVLPRGAFSDCHAHTGDELMVVMSGTVEVRLGNSGLWTHLEKHDYIHFYAEQEHSVRNIGRSRAVVFIIMTTCFQP